MKVGIITIIGNNNYGNRLQNYALQNALEKLNVNVITLKNEPFSNTKKGYLLRLLKNFKNKGTYSEDENRRKAFEKFNENITFSNKKINAFSKYNGFDYIIVGSDQVWNPSFLRLRDVDLLSNVNSTKRIAYSASFGINELPNNVKTKARKEFVKFKAISVREDKGKEIIEELTDRSDVEVLIDPTMLLTYEDWSKVTKKPKQLKCKKYILNYFLGNLSDSRKKEIERIAKENECEIINILDKKSPYYASGPSEFLYLEKNAFLICTDSFHSCVFAIIFNRPFIIFDREQNGIENMNSRLETLLEKFQLKNRKFNGKKITAKNLNHDYKDAYKILEKEREKSKKFIENAMNIKK